MMASRDRSSKQMDALAVLSEVELDFGSSRLPWGASRERAEFPEGIKINSSNLKSGELVLHLLFAEFTVLAERKIKSVLTEHDKQKLLSKSLQRGDDLSFDQLLVSLCEVADHSLPALLTAMFNWYDRQMPLELGQDPKLAKNKVKVERPYLNEKRDLAVDFLFCLVLIEILKKLHLHPGHDGLVERIIFQAFRRFKYKESNHTGQNAVNHHYIADLYAEVIGVLAQSRFAAVRSVFFAELKELRNREMTPANVKGVMSLLMGVKFFRVKMHPIEEFRACFQFLQECGQYFLDVREKEIKHCLAGLFVEILLPVAAVVKNEVNVPVLKNFVELLYAPTLDRCHKKNHSLVLLPMVTCLLCVSHRQFFLTNWPGFLLICLGHLREPKMSRVALESLYRLVWVYMIRIKCESNTATFSRLQSITTSLFPKGSKIVVPKDLPLNIFVKIIHFIAQERLDFAMKEIIYDLLSVGRPKILLFPERMSIGIRAFLVIADGLQQRDGNPPPMPQTVGTLPSGGTLRSKRAFMSKYLSEEMAKTIGMSAYYTHVRRAFDSILRNLDQQVGKPLLRTKAENLSRDPEEIIIGEKKPKIDLFRTCAYAIPRLLPEGLSQMDLVELLSRLTVHMDEELAKLAFQSLQNVVVDLPQWRNAALQGFVKFVNNSVSDSQPQLLDQCSRRIISLLQQWKSAVQAKPKLEAPSSNVASAAVPQALVKVDGNPLPTKSRLLGAVVEDPREHCHTLHKVEAFALVLMCYYQPIIRKLAIMILKEVRNLFVALNIAKEEMPVLDAMDLACPSIVERVLHILPSAEKAAALSASFVDFQWLAERTSIIWTPVTANLVDTNATWRAAGSGALDSWIEAIFIFMHPDFVLGQCPSAIAAAWPMVMSRLNALYVQVDPSNMKEDSRAASLLGRPGSRKMTTERTYMNLWQNYVVMSCSMAPPSQKIELRSASPDVADGSFVEKSESQNSARELFRLIVPLIKCECSDLRETVVLGLGRMNPAAFRDVVEEMIPIIKEAVDRKQERIRHRRRRDVLRLALVRIFRSMAENGIFTLSPPGVVEAQTHGLNATFVEYIEGARLLLEGDSDKDTTIASELKLHFTEFIRHLIRTTPIEKRKSLLSNELRYRLFTLFSSWSGRYRVSELDSRLPSHEDHSELELAALQGMCAMICCGPIFDPSGLNDEGFVYDWLSSLLRDSDDKIYQLAQETIIQLLNFNLDSQALLDWVVDNCYTGSIAVADGCFNSLAIVFSGRDYPCDHVAMLNITLLNAGCPRPNVRNTAILLFHLLYKRFFLDDVRLMSEMSDSEEDGRTGVGASQQVSSEAQKRQELQGALLRGPNSRSQSFLSTTLARLHPELTVPIFSEITQRYITAMASVRQSLVECLLPWLHNLELVDSTVQTNTLTKLKTKELDQCRPLQGNGWGTTQATQMVLNNLLYLTVRLADANAVHMEKMWGALVTYWPCNMRVIVRYLMIVSSIAPNSLLQFTRRVVVYLGIACTDRLIEELIIELQATEPLPHGVERTETPPFFRLTGPKKTMGICVAVEEPESLQLDRGVIHTKRHSADDPARSESASSATRSGIASAAAALSKGEACISNHPAEDAAAVGLIKQTVEPNRPTDCLTPFPLPMPAYGGFYAPMSDYMQDSNSRNSIPNPPFLRCNLAAMIMQDLVLSHASIDWVVHLPVALHTIFLGLDHSRPIVHGYCKGLLLALLQCTTSTADLFRVARVILSHAAVTDDLALTLPHSTHAYVCEEEQEIGAEAQAGAAGATDASQSTYEVTASMIEVLLESGQLWPYEDVSPRVHHINSAEQLELFLRCVLRVFNEALPQAHLEERWAQVALTQALSCSSRHYAGRSFEVFRALHMPMTGQMLSDVLSRLVETVAEQGEDMQGYVTEILLTLQACVVNTDDNSSADQLAKTSEQLLTAVPTMRLLSSCSQDTESRRSATVAARQTSHMAHIRSVSLAGMFGKLPGASPFGGNVIIPLESRCRAMQLCRSRSVVALRQIEELRGAADKTAVLVQMFWISVALLESDYDYEFLLAINLLDKVLRRLDLTGADVLSKLDCVGQQMAWQSFPGVMALLLKGCTSPVTAEGTQLLLAQVIVHADVSVVDRSRCIGFPLNIIALLPMLLEHFDDPPEPCLRAAENISQICLNKSEKLGPLATVMSLYAKRTFGKDRFQWTKCVVKYLYDVYSSLNSIIMSFLIEVLDKGPPTYQTFVLQMIHCVVHYVDLSASNHDFLKVVAKHIESNKWNEALKILKLCVAKTSTLAAAPVQGLTSVPLTPHMSFIDTEPHNKKELPGRVMDFEYNMASLHVIAPQFLDAAPGEESLPSKSAPSGNGSEHCASGWKRPHMSQIRTRDRLVSLLTSYGQRVDLPKSPSVIFSQSSDTIDRQPSSSSSENASMVDGIAGSVNFGDDSSIERHQMQVVKDFDFLDLEEVGSSEDDYNEFSWGVNRHRIEQDQPVGTSPSPGSSARQHSGGGDESSDDEAPSASPVDDVGLELASASTVTLAAERTHESSFTDAIVMCSPSMTQLSSDGARLSPALSVSSHSISDQEAGLLSPLPLSPVASGGATSSILSFHGHQIEEMWAMHVNEAMTDGTGNSTPTTLVLFPRLLQEVGSRVRCLTEEVIFLLSRTESLRQLISQLEILVNLLTVELQCPVVYADAEMVKVCRLIGRHQFHLLEIQESYETFSMRREQAIELLDVLKSSVKLQSESSSVEQLKLDVCRAMYRLHFQLLQLYECFAKLIATLAVVHKPSQVLDVSHELTELRDALVKAQSDDCIEPDVLPDPTDLGSPHDAEKILISALQERKFPLALHLTSLFRSIIVHEYGTSLGDDVETLLLLYCKYQAEARPGLLAICRCDSENVADICMRLMEFKVALTVHSAQLDGGHSFRSDSDSSFGKPNESSTL